MPRTWLCRDDFDRQRLLDMEERIRPVRKTAMGVVALALVVSGPWLGWWTLLPLVGAAGLFGAADKLLANSERPEHVMFAAWTGSELMIAAAVALSGGPTVPTTAWLAIPVVTLSARFSLRGVALGVGIALSLVLAVAFGVDAGAVLDNPPLVIAPATLVVATAILSTALMHSDVQHRGEAVVDPLTGMLNRKALANRASELGQQSDISGLGVGVVLGDLDHFKEINDSLGHAAGDAVLKDIAYLLRKQLRAFDLAYRIGGEEFLVLLPGADVHECARLAEMLRAAVETSTFVDGIAMTMSFGVSACGNGDGFDYDCIFAAADEALYEAKSLGRNRVCTAERDGQPPSISDPSRARGAATSTTV